MAEESKDCNLCKTEGVSEKMESLCDNVKSNEPIKDKEEVESKMQIKKPIVDDVWGDEDNIKSYEKKKIILQEPKGDDKIFVGKMKKLIYPNQADIKNVSIHDDIFDAAINHFEESALDRINRLKREETLKLKK